MDLSNGDGSEGLVLHGEPAASKLGDSIPDVRHTPSRCMRTPLTEAWVGTQIHVVAAAGLASSHAAPFVRLLYQIPKRKTVAKEKRRRGADVMDIVSLDNEVVEFRLRREHNGRHTAIWGNPTESSDNAIFRIPPAVPHVEIQLWNHFANGFEVFLGMTTVSIETLHQQLCEDDDEGKSFESRSWRNNATVSIVDTPAMWYPLQLAKDNVHAARANLSVQLQISFICETKSYDIWQKIVQRAATRKRSKDKGHGGATGMTADEKLHDAVNIADPAFAFTKPFHPIDWSSVVSTSLRHIFFHVRSKIRPCVSKFVASIPSPCVMLTLSWYRFEPKQADVDRLSSFTTQVLYGDLVRELQEDPGLHVHEGHVAAFQMYQFSAQYLDHCVNTLAARRDDYCDQYRVLAESHEKLVQTRSQLKQQRDRLKKQSNELELLLTTYKSIAEKESPSISVEEAMPSEGIGNLHDMHQQRSRTKPPTKLAQENSPKADSMKKPVFLMTWEERERKRKLDKELSKAQRIEDEKRRLEQLALDRKARDEHQLRLSSLLARGRERAACVIQRLTRQKNAEYKLKFAAQRHRAAVAIQRHVRGYKCRKVYPLRLEQHRTDIESNRIEQNDLEMRVFLQREEQQRQQHHTIRVQSLSQDCGPASPSPNKQEVGDLVSMWRKLRRIFVLARSSSGTQYRSLFQKLDLRQDGLVDRAEFRLGVRSFGIRIDRKLTRALIALVRAKSGSPSQPLLISFDQFVRGFDLPQQDGGASEAPIESTYDREMSPSRSSDGKPQQRSSTGSQEAKQSKRDDDANSNDADSDDTATRVAQAVENLRQKIVDAATSHLEVTGKSISNYRDFRDALIYVFGEFDADGNGELDMNEFVACIESINFRVTEDNLALLRECFAWDHESDRIGIAEFISFALARPGSGGDENLGAAGSRMPDAILQRVRSARKQTDTIEDAVRFVFRRAYRTKADQRCSVAIFMRTLAALQLGIKPAQLARLVMRLDKDGDRSISFDELLIWLRLRSPSAEVKPIDAPTNHFERRMPTSSAIAKLVRALLHQIAGVDLFTSSQTSRQGLLQRVFEKIDCNNSKKITKQEIQQFLDTEDLGSMQDLVDAIAGQESSPKSRSAVLADAIVSSIDLNRNGVITLDEWIECLEPTEPNPAARMDRFAMIDSVRVALRTAMKDEETLIAWFHSLPGAIPVPSTGKAKDGHMKVRISEFKSALRSKLGVSSLPLQAIEEAIKRLDSDSSGWITTLEMQNWTFPLRDLEELVAIIVSRWRDEVQTTSSDDFALTLYNRFDADGNGILAQREIRGGFASFGLNFRQEEVPALVNAFDQDHDGCWSKAEFLAFVYKILPQQIFPQDEGDADATDEAYTDEQATYEDEGFQSSGADDDADKLDNLDDDKYAEDGFSAPSSSSAALSFPPDSPGKSSVKNIGEHMAGEYNEDFD